MMNPRKIYTQKWAIVICYTSSHQIQVCRNVTHLSLSKMLANPYYFAQ